MHILKISKIEKIIKNVFSVSHTHKNMIIYETAIVNRVFNHTIGIVFQPTCDIIPWPVRATSSAAPLSGLVNTPTMPKLMLLNKLLFGVADIAYCKGW